MLKHNLTNIKKENFVKFYLNNNLITKSINDPQETLLDFLRINQNLKGTKGLEQMISQLLTNT